MAAYVLAWFWGGRPERFAAAVLLVVCVIIGLSFAFPWGVEDPYLPGRITDCVLLLVFGWMCFRSNRWWPFLMTATLGLMVMVNFAALLDPDISQWAIASAKVGLGYLVDLTLMLSVFERWLAGEAPAGRAAWARADIATVARRNRKEEARPSAAALDEPAKACA